MGVTQYIGARYVPVFADPIEWSSSRKYEPLTIVLHGGNSYTSKQSVPKNIDISDTRYWASTGVYNAQIEQYRDETAQALTIARQANTDAINAHTAATGALNKANVLEPKVAALETDNAQNKADIEDLQERVAIVPDQIVIIGDSWAAPTEGGIELVPPLRDSLNAKPNDIHNYAIGGTGFIIDTDPNFSAQLATAIADPAYSNERVKYVIIIGGTNDYVYAPTDAGAFTPIINSMMQSIHNAFTNAETHIFFMQGAKNRKYPYSLIKSVIEGCNYKNIHNAAWPISFNMFRDNLHPTATGYKEFARYITETLQGGNFSPLVQTVDFTAKFNSKFPDYHYPATEAILKTSWTETTSTDEVILTLSNDSTNTNDDLNGYVNNVTTGNPVFTDNGQPPFYLSSIGVHSGGRYIQTVVVPDNRVGFVCHVPMNLSIVTTFRGAYTRIL